MISARDVFAAGAPAVIPRARCILWRSNCWSKIDLPIDGLRSKNWEEFARPGAPQIDFVFTVCDNAAGEVCPVWPGRPMTAHWGIPDPAAVEGTVEERRKAFFIAYSQLSNRLSTFVNLPLNNLDKLSLKKKLDEIGKTGERTETA